MKLIHRRSDKEPGWRCWSVRWVWFSLDTNNHIQYGFGFLKHSEQHLLKKQAAFEAFGQTEILVSFTMRHWFHFFFFLFKSRHSVWILGGFWQVLHGLCLNFTEMLQRDVRAAWWIEQTSSPVHALQRSRVLCRNHRGWCKTGDNFCACREKPCKAPFLV